MVLFALLGCSDYNFAPEPDPVEAACADAPPDAYDPGTDLECRGEPEIGTFEPIVEWQWNTNPVHPGYEQIMSTPAVGELTDDNGDGSIDENDVPDIVFCAFIGGAYTSPGALVAISGDDGHTLWSVTLSEGHMPYGASGVAIADLRGNGDPSVIAAATDGIMVMKPNGELRWWASVPGISPYTQPAVANLDGEGPAEIIAGNYVFAADGTPRWVGAGGVGGWPWFSFGADLDQDGLAEVIAGNTVYDAQGNVLWNDGLPDGMPATVDLDLDGDPEIVRVGSNRLIASNADGTTIWNVALIDGANGGPPTVADFDGDGAPEIGVAGAAYYQLFEADGTLRWSAPVVDMSSNVTGSSVFDFEGDGAAEVVYADEHTLWVLDGATGAVEMAYDPHSSGTLFEYPLVVDADNDGASEIVLASNDYAFTGSRGITLIGDANSSWMPSRPVWNQGAYSISNVNDDGSIPAVADPNWSQWNSFRAGNSESPVGLGAADLRAGEIERCTAECAEGTATIYVPIENHGLAPAFDFEVALVAARGATETELQRIHIDRLNAGEMTWLGPLSITDAEWGANLAVVVDPDGRVRECDTANNRVEVGEFACGL